jgi:hypothetical protein
MSMPNHVRPVYPGASARRTGSLLLLALGAAACAPAKPPVSYAGLDAPLDAEAPPPIWIGVLADTTGPDAARGRAFAETFRGLVESASPVRERELRVRILDDRSRAEAITGAAERVETDVGVLLVVTAPGADRGERAADVAYRTPLVSVNGGAPESMREGAFCLETNVDTDARGPTDLRGVAGSPESAAIAAAKWVLEALQATPEWGAREVASTLRAKRNGETARAGRIHVAAQLCEGVLPAREPYLFRAPPAPAAKH